MSLLQRQIHLGFDPRPQPVGAHLCLLYGDEGERREVITRYVERGLQDTEDVHYFADVDRPEDLDAQPLVSDFRSCTTVGTGRLFLSRAVDTYCPHGRFSVEEMLATLEAAQNDALAAGRPGARVSGEMTWSQRGLPGSERLVEYEARINALVQRVPVTALCQYDTRRFDGKTLYDILRVHPKVILRGRIVENPYFVSPEAYLAEQTERG